MNAATMPSTTLSDADLVTRSLAGDRGAFGELVARYQSLVCSLAYSATGRLSLSEDLAQETFLAAWRQLPHLREPGKVRAWLCSIARNRIADALRLQRRDPTHTAAPLDLVQDSPAPEPLPAEQTIGREEEAILWRSLENIPEIFREPLVLFYREHQSIEQVAEALELSEDAVKQRLSRGRKLLHEQVLAFVESTLERTNPGKAFTVAVLAALPALATSANAAPVGATATTGGVVAKILLMTKITHLIIAAAVAVIAVLLTSVAWHRYRQSASVEAGRTAVGALPPEGAAGALTPEQAAAAQQTARSFLEAVGKGDWGAVADLWPPGGKRVDDVFTDKVKAAVEGLVIVQLGEPFTKPGYPGVFVPYEIRFKNGEVKKWNLAVRRDNPERRWLFDGGF